MEQIEYFTIEISEDSSEVFEKKVDKLYSESKSKQYEGIMIKPLDSVSYISDNKSNWIKYKQKFGEIEKESLDLIVMGVYKGKGKRSLTFGSYLVGAWNSKTSTYWPITKVGTGFSDEDLSSLTDVLTDRIEPELPQNYWYCYRLKPDFWVKPEIVLEIDYTEMTLSPIYRIGHKIISDDKGLSLRFPRFKRLRSDKSPSQCTTTDQILEINKRSYKQTNFRYFSK